jgi:hypothetical protein
METVSLSPTGLKELAFLPHRSKKSLVLPVKILYGHFRLPPLAVELNSWQQWVRIMTWLVLDLSV